MKRKLLFVAALAAGALGTLRAQDLVSPTSITVGEFTALSGSYTIEVSATSGTEVKVPFDKYSYFTYTPTVTGTVRFISNGSTVYVYEKESSTFEYKGTASFTAVTYPSITDDNVNSSTNLVSNGDYRTLGDEITTNRYKLGSPWVFSDDSKYGSTAIRVNNNQGTCHDNCGLVWRADNSGYYKCYYYQEMTNLSASGKYQAVIKVAETGNSGNNGSWNVGLGSSIGGHEYSSQNITAKQGTYTKELTTPSTLGDKSYFIVYDATTASTAHYCNVVDYVALVEANAISAGITGASSAQYVAEAAYPTWENGTDMTSKLTNASVTDGTGWTGAATTSGQQYTGAPDNTYFDCGWNTSENCRQVVTLPAGYYLLKAATRSASSEVTDANIYANNASNSSLNQSVNSFREGSVGNLLGNGWAWTRVSFHVEEPADITIGFYAKTTGHGWAGADNFSLTYYDSAENLATALVQGAKDDAAGWKTNLSGTIPNGGLTALQTAIDDASATVSSVESAITAARALVTPYANYLAAKVNMDAIASVATTDATKAASRKAEFLDAVVIEAEAASTTEEINTAISKINPAVINYIKKLTPSDAENAPFDLTFMITNPSFSTNEMTGWTGTKPNFGNDATQKAAYACEYFQTEFDIYQQLTGMATGNYRLKVKAYQRPGASGTVVPAYVNAEDKADGTFGTTSEIYVNGGNEASQAIKNAASPMRTEKVGTGNESEVEVSGTKYYIPNDMVSAVAYFNAGHYENEAEILATSSTIKFGFRSTATHVTADWTIFDDFRLYYTGQLDLSTFAASLASKVTEASSVKTTLTGSIPAAALTALQTAIDDNDNSDDTFEEEEQFTEAIANLDAAIAAAQALVTPYATYTATKTVVNNIKNQDVYADEAGAVTTFNSAVSSADAAVAEATSVSAINTQTTALTTAVKTLIAAVDINSGEYFDLTGLIQNAGLDAATGWEGSAPAYNVSCAEFFNVDFNFYQTIPSMPAGNYELHVQAFQRPGNYSSVSANDAINAFIYINNDANSTTVKNVMSEYSATALYSDENKGAEPWVGPYDYTADSKSYPNGMTGARRYFDAGYYENVVLTGISAGDLTFGFKCTNHAEGAWTLFDNFRLYYYGTSINVAIDETKDFSVVSNIENANVTLTRSIKAGINTLVLPFTLSQAEVEEAFGTGSKVYTISAYDAVKENVTFAVGSGITANKPCLLEAKAAGTSYTFEGRTIVAGTPTDAVDGIQLVGRYVASTTVPRDGKSYVVSDGNLYLVDSAVTVKGTRAYFQLTDDEPAGAKARVLSMTFDGDATGIATVEADGTVNVETGIIYNLNGQRVAAPQKGIYIVNGKKVLFK